MPSWHVFIYLANICYPLLCSIHNVFKIKKNPHKNVPEADMFLTFHSGLENVLDKWMCIEIFSDGSASHARQALLHPEWHPFVSVSSASVHSANIGSKILEEKLHLYCKYCPFPPYSLTVQLSTFLHSIYIVLSSRHNQGLLENMRENCTSCMWIFYLSI